MISYEYDCDPEDCEADFKSLGPETGHTARKHHGCETCEGTIAPGQRYKRFVSLNEGRFEIIKWHADRAECQQAGADRIAQEKARREADNEAMDALWQEEAERRSKECQWCGKPVEPPGLCGICSQEYQDHYGTAYGAGLSTNPSDKDVF